ncbi:MAG: hypothetical protein WAT37_13380 [Saprospiraceae bacterium]
MTEEFFKIDNSIIELISKGVIGLSALLALAAFYLIRQEQKKPTIRPEMMKIIKLFLSFNLANTVIVGLFTLPTFQKNKELSGSLSEVHHIQEDIQVQDTKQVRLMDSLSAVTVHLQDSISQMIQINNLVQERSNAISDITSQINSQLVSANSLLKDTFLLSTFKAGVDSVEASMSSVSTLIEKEKNSTLTPSEKTTLIKKANELNNRIFKLKKAKNTNTKEVLTKKIETISKTKN